VHFNDKGLAKVTLGIGVGRQKQDKREAIKDRDWKRDKARMMAHRG
jgi:SsrA-binding protein